MSAQDETVMEDKNYVKVAQLYGIMKTIDNINPMAFERLLQECDDLDNLHLIMEDLLKGVDINYQVRESTFFKSKIPHLIGFTLLHLAAEKNDIKMFKFFIKKGADFTIKNDNKSTVVHQMIYKSPFKKYFDPVTDEYKLEQDPFVELVLAAHIEYQNSSNPRDKYGVSHFSVACMTNNVKAVEFFLEQGVSPDETVGKDSKQWPGYTPLHFAAEYCAVEVAEILLSRHANPNTKDSRGMTPLHVAAKYCAVEIAEILLMCDANPNTKDSRGMTPLQLLLEEKMKIWRKKTRMMAIGLSDGVDRYSSLASLLGNEKISVMLLRNQRTIADEFGFYVVCTMKDSQIIEYFLNSRVVDLNRAIASDSPFCPGYTAAHFAAHFNVETFKLLVKKGANMTVRNTNGQTPLDICFERFKAEDLYDLIQSHSEWSKITFSNGKTRLLDFVGAMRKPTFCNNLMRKQMPMYSHVQLDSPICAGYTPLDLVVTCTETCPSNWGNRAIRMPRYFDRIASCLILGADVTAENGDGLTAIHRAFKLCENQVVLNLLQHQAKICNPVDSDGLSHFHIACIVDHKDLIKKLIVSGIVVNIPIGSSYRWYKVDSCSSSFISKGSTPLHLLADAGDLQMTKLMIKHNANVFAKDADGLTAVERAVKSIQPAELGRSNLIDFLIKTSISKVANATNDFDALKELLYRIPKCFNMRSLFVSDNKYCDRILVDSVMLERVFTKMDITMLHVACFANSHEQVRKQLANGADVNARVNEDSPFHPGCTPLHIAVHHQYTPTNDVLHVDASIVKSLLDAGADVTIANCSQQTPLHQVFDWFSGEELDSGIVDTLLKSHKDFRINPKDARGLSHFHMACYRNFKDIVDEFLKAGIDVNQPVDHFAKNFGGYSPLHFAMIRPNKEVYSLLLKHEADVNARDRLGNTPLHVAVKCEKWSDTEFFSSMLRAEADPNAKNLMHETVLEILITKEKVTPKVIADLNSYGARINVINPISREGCLALASIVLRGKKLVFDELTKFPDIMDTDENGCTIFHNIVTGNTIRSYSIYSSFKNIERGSYGLPYKAKAIEILTRLNSQIDSKDKTGMTALQTAIQNHDINGTVGLLLNGADINVMIDASGKTSFTHIVDIVNSHQLTQTMYRVVSTVTGQLNSYETLIYRILAVHVHKMLYAKIYVSEANKNAYLQARRQFQMENINIYKAELEELEKQQVGSSCFTLGDFLSETGVVISYADMLEPQRQEIDEFFNDNEVESLYKRFPVMTSLLKLQYRKALARAELLLSAAEALNLLLGFNIPVLCSDVLMRLLTDQELKNLIASERFVD